MARHRKIDVRMWGDEKFRRLTAPAPCGQFLWLYLLTGPHTTTIPGLLVCGELALAEALGWPLEGLRNAFQEVFREGLVKADWKARVIWLPNAVKYNRPESPNVVKSWASYWEEVPECSLKAEVYQRFMSFLEGMGEAFAEAGKAFGKPSSKTMPIDAFHEGIQKGFVEGFVEGIGKGIQDSDSAPINGQVASAPGASNGPAQPIPASLDTPEFREAWARWEKYRREKRQKLTPSTAAAQLKKLSVMGLVLALEALDRSISNGWTGLFPPKDRAGKPLPPEPAPPSRAELDARIFRERAEYEEQREAARRCQKTIMDVVRERSAYRQDGTPAERDRAAAGAPSASSAPSPTPPPPPSPLSPLPSQSKEKERGGSGGVRDRGCGGKGEGGEGGLENEHRLHGGADDGDTAAF